MSDFLGKYAPEKKDAKRWPLYDGHSTKAVNESIKQHSRTDKHKNELANYNRNNNNINIETGRDIFDKMLIDDLGDGISVDEHVVLAFQSSQHFLKIYHTNNNKRHFQQTVIPNQIVENNAERYKN
jgi:hypothetical protein